MRTADGRFCRSAEMHAQRAGMEAGITKRMGHGMRGDRKTIHGADKVSALVAGLVVLEASLALFRQESGQTVGSLRTFRLICWQKYQQVRIAAPQPGNELSSMKHDLRIRRPRQRSRSRFRILSLSWKRRPFER